MFAVDRAYYCIASSIFLPFFIPKEQRTKEFFAGLFGGMLLGILLTFLFFPKVPESFCSMFLDSAQDT